MLPTLRRSQLTCLFAALASVPLEALQARFGGAFGKKAASKRVQDLKSLLRTKDKATVSLCEFSNSQQCLQAKSLMHIDVDIDIDDAQRTHGAHECLVPSRIVHSSIWNL